MAGWTNKGKFRALGRLHRGVALPSFYSVMLVTSATAPNADTNLMSDLTQVAAGNGYADGGLTLSLNSTDFDVLTEDDTNDRGVIQIKDLVWTATGGSLPASGSGARYAVLGDDNLTVSLREVYYYWDLVSDRAMTTGESITLKDLEMRMSE